MKVLIDPQIFNHQVRGGISRYVYELINGLSYHKQINVACPLIYSKNIFIQERKKYLRILNFLFDLFSIKTKYWNRIFTILYLKLCKVDIFIPSFYETYYLKHLNRSKLVVTIHDMIHEKFPNYIEYSEKVISNKKQLIERADAIIAVSENTKNDIIELFPSINHSKIKVIYSGNSISEIYFSDIIRNRVIKNNYFVYVGLRKSYKNFSWMLQSLSSTLLNQDIQLICIGGGEFSIDEKIEIKELGVEELIIQMNATDLELINLYHYSIALIMPSLYEGFGFPIIEAMSVGCPVILNRNSCFPEIAGEAGCYYEVGNVDKFLLVVNKVISDVDYRSGQIMRGKDIVKKFSWERCISETALLLSATQFN